MPIDVDAITTIEVQVPGLQGATGPTGPTGPAGTTDHAALSHLDYASAAHTGFVPATRTLTAGSNLTGGGDLSADRSVALATSISLAAVTATGTVTAATVNLTGGGTASVSAATADFGNNAWLLKTGTKGVVCEGVRGLQVRANGGTANVDEVWLTHDGTSAIVQNQNGTGGSGQILLKDSAGNPATVTVGNLTASTVSGASLVTSTEVDTGVVSSDGSLVLHGTDSVQLTGGDVSCEGNITYPGRRPGYLTKGSDYTIDPADPEFIIFDFTGSDVTFTLPQNLPDRMFCHVVNNSDTNQLVISIEKSWAGSPTGVNINKGYAQFLSNGNGWQTLAVGGLG